MLYYRTRGVCAILFLFHSNSPPNEDSNVLGFKRLAQKQFDDLPLRELACFIKNGESMLPTKPEGYISIVASNFVFPIVSLFESLNNVGAHPPNEVQASPIENGYSLAIITLTVLMVESAVSRTQYMMKVSPPQKALKFIKKIFSNDLYQKVEEIFVIRDTIAHNHVWEANIYWDENGMLRLVDAQRVKGYGDNKFEKAVDDNNRKTKLLGLNVFPNRICRTDAVIVLRTAFEFLSETERKDHNYFSVSALLVKYKGNMIDFRKFISEISV